MKKPLVLITLLVSSTIFSQIDTLDQRMVSMSDTYQKPHKVGSVYYEKGNDTPFTGVLYGKFDNGKYLSIQEYKNGIGNGNWINYYKDGTIKEIGNYTDNLVEGPIKQFHPNGKLKAEGTYKHWRQKVGLWKYYDENGNFIKSVRYD